MTTNMAKYPFWWMWEFTHSFTLINKNHCKTLGLDGMNYAIIDVFVNYENFKYGLCIPN